MYIQFSQQITQWHHLAWRPEVGLSSRDLAAGLVGGHGLERIAVLHVRGATCYGGDMGKGQNNMEICPIWKIP